MLNYKITGLVDMFDEGGNIIGQYPVGSIQKLTVKRGNVAVEAGQAEVTDEQATDADAADADDSETDLDETDEDADEDATGETGEGEVE